MYQVDPNKAMTELSKKCTKCGDAKALCMYNKHGEGFTSRCKGCLAEGRLVNSSSNTYKDIIDIEGEFWREIHEYNGAYMISNKGRVKSTNYNHTGKEQLLKLNKDLNGYIKVELCKNNIKKKWFVHRLVAFSFIENIYNKPFINHINGVRADNRCENLEWCTAKENMYHSLHIMNRVPNTKGKFNINGRFVLQLDDDNNIIAEFPSIAQAARDTGSFSSAISACLSGKIKHTNKYQWRYKNV